MTTHVPGFVAPSRSWATCTLREKRTRLVEERLGAVVAEARLLGIGPAELAEALRHMYDEEEP